MNFNKIVEEKCNYIKTCDELPRDTILLDRVFEFYSYNIEAKIRLLVSTYIRLSENSCTTDPRDALIKQVKSLLISKGVEYGSKKSRLHNFYLGADLILRRDHTPLPVRTLPLFVCDMFQLKHIASIIDLLTGELKPSQDVLDEKIVDAINYCILHTALKEEAEE